MNTLLKKSVWFTAMLTGFGLMSTTVMAQIFPPDLLCIKGDTLFWDLPVNTCGTFNSYDIYWSTDPDGPYALLLSVTNPGQTAYYDPNPGSELRYYYMRSNYNCFGEPALSSDTLDNLPPAAVAITAVTVAGNSVDISWEPSASPEVAGYIIYRQTNIGLLPIDTVFGVTGFTDINAEPDVKSESYTVLALDNCGSTSIFDDTHRTVFLEAVPSSCEQTLRLTWNLYEKWPDGIRRHDIWLSTNGGPAILIDTVEAGGTQYTVEDLNDGFLYCATVRAVSASGVISASNEVCLTADIVQPMRNLVIANTSLNAGNQTQMQYVWDTSAEITSVNILSSSDGENFSIIQTFPPVFPLSLNNTFPDNSNDPATMRIWYRIETIDACDSVAVSNTAATIHLTGTPLENRTNLLQWTPYENDTGTAVAYDIYRYVGNSGSLLSQTDPATLTYTDTVEVSNPAESYICYAVVAKAQVETGAASPLPVETRSNTVCVAQFADLQVPNAFSPRGYNQEFKPLIVFGSQITAYELSVYDRWGKRLFLSDDPAIGWNGENAKGEDLPFGLYTWRIRMEQQNGRILEETGVVQLIR